MPNWLEMTAGHGIPQLDIGGFREAVPGDQAVMSARRHRIIRPGRRTRLAENAEPGELNEADSRRTELGDNQLT
jgi:hypothetical protein